MEQGRFSLTKWHWIFQIQPQRDCTFQGTGNRNTGASTAAPNIHTQKRRHWEVCRKAIRTMFMCWHQNSRLGFPGVVEGQPQVFCLPTESLCALAIKLWFFTRVKGTGASLGTLNQLLQRLLCRWNTSSQKIAEAERGLDGGKSRREAKRVGYLFVTSGSIPSTGELHLVLMGLPILCRPQLCQVEK